MNQSNILAVLFILFSSVPRAFAVADVDFKKEFGTRDGCFVVADLRTGQTVAEHNAKRCGERFSPCSSFKVAAALMAFDKGILKDENQVIKWDGVKRDRSELNQDQTPFTWMSTSAKWVTEWVMPQLGPEAIQKFLSAFNYGNKDFSGGLKDAWVTSSLKISAREQLALFQKFWKGELPVASRAMDFTKKIIFIKKLGKSSELYGKTGTGCLEGRECMEHADKMLGWFVGALKTENGDYVFAANASDLVPQKQPGGPRMRDTAIEILKKMGLVK